MKKEIDVWVDPDIEQQLKSYEYGKVYIGDSAVIYPPRQ